MMNLLIPQNLQILNQEQRRRKRIKSEETKKSKKLRVDFRRGMFILSKVLKGIVHPEMKIVKALSE